MLSSQLNPFYISGLIQADGSFFVTLHKNPKSKFGVTFRPTLSLTLINSPASHTLLSRILTFFNCGFLVTNTKKNCIEWRVTSLDHLVSFIFPHFLDYPLFGLKHRSFSYVFFIVSELRLRAHYSYDSFLNLIKLSLCLNQHNYLPKLARWERFLHVPLSCSIHFVSPLFTLFDPFLIGLIDGDGCFCINFFSTGKISFLFQISGDSSQFSLFSLIQQRLSCGTIQTSKSKNLINFKVSSKKHLLTHVLPFLSHFVFFTDKSQHFLLFRDLLLKFGLKRLTFHDKLEIVDLAYNMNLGGKRRHLTKEAYLQLLTTKFSHIS